MKYGVFAMTDRHEGIYTFADCPDREEHWKGDRLGSTAYGRDDTQEGLCPDAGCRSMRVYDYTGNHTSCIVDEIFHSHAPDQRISELIGKMETMRKVALKKLGPDGVCLTPGELRADERCETLRECIALLKGVQ